MANAELDRINKQISNSGKMLLGSITVLGVGVFGVSHEQAAINHHDRNNNLQRAAIEQQANEKFPLPPKADLENNQAFINHIQEELSQMIQQGNFAQAKDTISETQQKDANQIQMAEQIALNANLNAELEKLHGPYKPYHPNPITFLGSGALVILGIVPGGYAGNDLIKNILEKRKAGKRKTPVRSSRFPVP